MKTVGIAADNFKLDKFKKELAKAGFNDLSISAFTTDTSFMKVTVKDEDVKEVYKICQKVEMHFKQ